MAQTRTIPSREYAAGNYEFELNTLPGNSQGAEFIFTRGESLNSMTGLVLIVDVYYRQNNSSPWIHRGGITVAGGVIPDKQGNPLTTSSIGFTWPGEAGPNGRVMLKGSDVKVVAQVLQTFTTTITINSIS